MNSPFDELARIANRAGQAFENLWEVVNLNIRYPLPRGWLIFQGERTGHWWSIPDDDRCPGALFDTREDAYRFASEHRAGGQR